MFRLLRKVPKPRFYNESVCDSKEDSFLNSMVRATKSSVSLCEQQFLAFERGAQYQDVLSIVEREFANETREHRILGRTLVRIAWEARTLKSCSRLAYEECKRVMENQYRRRSA